MNNSYNISTEELEEIGQYLAGEMEPGLASAFTARLQADPLLQQKLREVELMQVGIAEAGLKKRLDSYHSDIAGLPGTEAPQQARVVSFARKLLVAASLLAIIGLPLWWVLTKESKREQLYGSYYSPDPGLVTAMSSSSNYTFEKAMVEYKNGEYNKAITAWTSLLIEQPASDTLQYFLGAAYQASGDFTKAIPLLEKTAANSQSSFYRDACWYLGLALLKNKETDKALSYLEKSGHVKSGEVIRGLSEK